MWQKILWYLKQLIPLSYWTTYTQNGNRIIVFWRMWFGHSYDILEFNVEPVSEQEAA